jgi:hypothetical protein
MQCPHCLKHIHEGWMPMGSADGDQEFAHFAVSTFVCPACARRLIRLRLVGKGLKPTARDFVVYPAHAMRPPPPEVPDPYATDFREAVAVLQASPKASAALSRRNLQAIIRDKAGIKAKDLSTEIQTLIAQPGFPSELAGTVDAVRNVRNLAAHPIKETNTGAIVEVEPEEADWLLEVLEGLLDYYFVQPAKATARRATLNAKLQQAGKPPMK